MGHLYHSQAEVVDALEKAYKNPELTIQHHNYIAGEMGTGKTYMGSAIINDLKPKRALISCPASMPKKWQNVFQEFNDEVPVIYNKEMTKDDILNTKVLIVVQKDLYTVVKKLYQDDPQFKVFEATVRRNVARGAMTGEVTDFADHFKHIYDFVIADEIHTYQPTHQDFRALAFLCESNIQLLGLTGTLFKQNIADLHCLLTLTNPEFNGLDYTDDNLRDPSWFYPNIWQYISVPISLRDVERNQAEEKSEEDIKQKIMPLHSIKLSDEQEAWYDLANINLARLNIPQRKIDLETTNYLDLPQVKQPTVKRTKPDNINSNDLKTTRIRNIFDIGMTLRPIKIEDTPKYKQLADILAKNPDKTIIFIQDNALGKILTKKLPKAFIIPASVDKSDVANYVNSRLDSDYDITIATTKQISTGIDLNSAHQIIWYQTPNDVTAILQAQRRVLRLNSTDDSKVWFLYYANTAQEQTILDVSQATTNNAAAYNVRATDNLAKVKGILFGNIDSGENEE